RREGGGGAVAELPVGVGDGFPFGHHPVDGLAEVDLEQRVRVVRRAGREVWHRVAHHVERLVGAGAVDDAGQDAARQGRQRRHLHPFIGTGGDGRQRAGVGGHGGGGGVIT